MAWRRTATHRPRGSARSFGSFSGGARTARGRTGSRRASTSLLLADRGRPERGRTTVSELVDHARAHAERRHRARPARGGSRARRSRRVTRRRPRRPPLPHARRASAKPRRGARRARPGARAAARGDGRTRRRIDRLAICFIAAAGCKQSARGLHEAARVLAGRPAAPRGRPARRSARPRSRRSRATLRPRIDDADHVAAVDLPVLRRRLRAARLREGRRGDPGRGRPREPDLARPPLPEGRRDEEHAQRPAARVQGQVPPAVRHASGRSCRSTRRWT